jgi:putative ABC transport system ATP-binding protein
MTIIRLMKAIRDKLRTTFVFSTHDARIINEVESVYHIEDGILKSAGGGI